MPEQSFLFENWEPITAIVGILLTALSTFGLVVRPRAKGRAKLKLDLEIYKLMSETQANWTHMSKVKSEIEGLSEQIYTDQDVQLRGIYFATGLVFFIGFGWWTIDILWADTGEFSFSWWAILTAYWCVVGATMVVVGASRRFSHKMLGTRGRMGGSGGQTTPEAGAQPSATED